MHHHRPIQRGISMVFVVIFTLAIAVAITSSYFIFSQNQQQKLNTINSFEDCAKHYPVMESYPQQCTTTDGKHFTRQLTEEEKQRLAPPIQSSPAALSNETAKWKLYTNSEYGYSFRYPPEYSNPLAAHNNSSPKFLNIFSKKAEPYIELGVISYLDNKKSSDCSELSNGSDLQDISVDGVKGCEVLINTGSNFQYYALVKKDDLTLSITLTANEKQDLEENKNTFNQILTSFKFLE